MIATPKGPILAAGLWQQVIRACGNRCCCAGWCGRTHKKDLGRRPREGRETSPLHAVPRAHIDGGELGDVAAMRLTAGDLTALCDDCHSGLLTGLRRASRLAAARALKEAPGLFDPAIP